MYKQSAFTSVLTPPNTPYQHFAVFQEPSFQDFDAPLRPYNHFQPLPRFYTRAEMAGFLSREAERALMGEGEGAEILFNQQTNMPVSPEFEPAFLDEDSEWAHAHSDASGFDYFHPYPHVSQEDYQYSSDAVLQSPPLSAGPLTSGQMPADTSPEPSHRASLSVLAPPSRSRSRSNSPNPEGLQKYGTLNADNRTWRCAYPSCNSKAVFARPCDLRKHFHRHSKSFFCRHEGCPQATQGGFSSKKDRVRHEAKHNPGIECEFEGCDRIFSRMDNMKDHLKRIHKKTA